jgi:hypothetical protein
MRHIQLNRNETRRLEPEGRDAAATCPAMCASGRRWPQNEGVGAPRRASERRSDSNEAVAKMPVATSIRGMPHPIAWPNVYNPLDALASGHWD